MKGLWIAVATCLLVSLPLRGDEWRREYEEGLQYYTEEDLMKRHPEKSRPVSFKHPPFFCPDMMPSASTPASVEVVKAADIKVIAALGDSLTTAIGANATTVLGIPIEYRHVSWSIGGYGTFQNVITLANILRLFNPGLVGAAQSRTVHGTRAPLTDTGFNLAVTGHNTFNLPGQTRHLIDTMKMFEDINFDEDWKLLTILIGMNDICDYCKDKSLFSVQNFIHYMSTSMEMLMNEVPRMIVNVVQILPMEALREVQKPTPGCLLQRSFCSCLVKPTSDSADLKQLIEVNLQYQKALEELLHTDRFFKRDFAVVLQPFLKHADPPRLPNGKVDMSFFTPDCFHFTIKGHEELAKGLWNNMFQPEGEKFTVESFSNPIQLMCPPVDHPYIYTRPSAARSDAGAPAGAWLITLLFHSTLVSVMSSGNGPGL
ncbi:phospholipase B1, membrane-associated isoform X1 [Tachysurus fulvidraco]|uniref:phospholipase B1, membrane-associated isoform X1 n=1 Tax=Tachysurus fulvidraco TaxID=1234273 RepID=UPI001FED754A|nr:phospholipase B1, membrane-associated isoform X1 [Tachysurus fulvidraco]